MIVILSFAVGTTVVLLFLYLMWYKSHSQFCKVVNRIPGPNGIPILGNALQVGALKSSAEFYRQVVKLSTDYPGGLCRIWLGQRPMILFYKAEFLESVLSSSKNSKKSIFYDGLRPWLNDGLLLSFGKKWHERRKLLTPTFHYTILEEFLEIFQEQSATLVALLHKAAAKGTPFNIAPYISNCTLDAICSTSMGIHLNAQEHQSDYVDAVHRIGSVIMQRVSSPWYFNDKLFAITSLGREHQRLLNILHGFTKQVIQKRWSDFESDNCSPDGQLLNSDGISAKRKRLAFLDLLLSKAKADGTLSVEDIQEEVDTFMFEGHDTTSSAIVWAIYNLGKYPDLQQNIREEFHEVSDGGKVFSLADFNQMKRLDCFLKESLRLFPTVQLIGREVTDEFTTGGYLIPVGCTVVSVTKTLHMDPEYFPDPEKFDPDRWITESVQRRHPYSYTPFSAGPRNCIGQKFAMLEEKVIIYHIMKEFYISCDETFVGEDRLLGELVLRPCDGLHVKLTPV